MNRRIALTVALGVSAASVLSPAAEVNGKRFGIVPGRDCSIRVAHATQVTIEGNRIVDCFSAGNAMGAERVGIHVASECRNVKVVGNAISGDGLQDATFQTE